jgi:hypothetical protein
MARQTQARLCAVLLAVLNTCAVGAAQPGSTPADATLRELHVDGAVLRLQLPAAQFTAGAAPLLEWITRSANIVTGYYRHFPVRELAITVLPTDGDGVNGGQTFGEHGAFIRVRVGREVTPAQLLDDWVLVHEMIHLALPDVGMQHAWLSEGLATYVEGVARAQAGNRSVADVWNEQVHSMPKGLPQSGDRGLDNTHTWGRTYWGGALFCLLADVEIHRQTHNRFGLQEALRAVTRESGGIVTDWPIERVFRTGDLAVGVHVLEDLYAKTKDSAVSPDLAALWRDLGIEPQEHSVLLHDDAPRADIRQAIMRPRAGS